MYKINFATTGMFMLNDRKTTTTKISQKSRVGWVGGEIDKTDRQTNRQTGRQTNREREVTLHATLLFHEHSIR